MKRLFLFIMLGLALSAGAEKTSSALYPAEVAAQVRKNAASDPWVGSVRDKVVEAAAFWKDMPDEELWSLMFGPTIERSWMVWSNGYSPITNKPVPMYNWVMDAQHHPWKVQDPTSGEWFPKNDFKAYYDSGLNEQKIFDPQRADRALLFNADHPDPADPLHSFGVDDGWGYVNEKGERWRFIGTYLIYGQFKQLVLGGARLLSTAYVITGEPVYARKAAILLDRVADLYPDFDFKTQAILYEGPAVAGYVSTWHDACEETRELVMAYDAIFPGMEGDTALVDFLSRKAAEVGLANKKDSVGEIRRNIEERILRDALAHPEKIYSNYPRTEIAKAITTAVLQEPEEAFWAIVDPMLQQATAVDGVTGEKGLAGYSAYTISALASFLAEFSKADESFLQRCVERAPRLRETYRFFIDTLCLQRYYPQIGDTGHYAGPVDSYVGMQFGKAGESLLGFSYWTLLAPSNYKLLWKFYELTGDPAYVQVAYRENGGKADGLPYDVYTPDAAKFQQGIKAVIAREGTLIEPPSVNKQEWHLGILRSGHGANGRALWIDYDAGGGHGHQDGLNIGLFAYGLDLMPELGYPPVQFGGWTSPRARWYTMTAAHNTVVVDGKNQPKGAGETTLWADGQQFHAIRVRCDALNDGKRLERTVALVDIDAAHFYVVDVIRVAGGRDHTKFFQSHFGTVATEGLKVAPAEDYGYETQLRNFQLDPAAQPGWSATWNYEDLYKLLPEGEKVGARYWDFTAGAAAGTAEGWLVPGQYENSDELWVPRIVVRRQAQGEAPFNSTFVSVFEPYRGEGRLSGVERIAVTATDGRDLGDGQVALKLSFKDGAVDTVVIRDAEAEAPAEVLANGIATDAQVFHARVNASALPTGVALIKGTQYKMGDASHSEQQPVEFVEILKP